MTSSLISYAKREINETIPGLQHGIYTLAPSKDGKPSILYVEDSFYYKPDIDGHQDRVSVSSEHIVNDLVRMHITSQLAYRMDQYPAFFAVPNEKVNEAELKVRFAAKIKSVLDCQIRWFRALVRIADDDWQQAHKYNMISDIQRTAARELREERDWLDDTHDGENKVEVGCPFCGSNLLDPEAPICPSCGKIHNPARLQEIEKRLGINSQQMVKTGS